jgi:hypothetical protein
MIKIFPDNKIVIETRLTQPEVVEKISSVLAKPAIYHWPFDTRPYEGHVGDLRFDAKSLDDYTKVIGEIGNQINDVTVNMEFRPPGVSTALAIGWISGIMGLSVCFIIASIIHKGYFNLEMLFIIVIALPFALLGFIIWRVNYSRHIQSNTTYFFRLLHEGPTETSLANQQNEFQINFAKLFGDALISGFLGFIVLFLTIMVLGVLNLHMYLLGNHSVHILILCSFLAGVFVYLFAFWIKWSLYRNNKRIKGKG